MTQIRRVIPRDNYQLEVQLENGNSVTLDFSSRLGTIRFGLLADQAFFRSAETDGTLIRWNGKIEISAGEVFQLAQK